MTAISRTRYFGLPPSEWTSKAGETASPYPGHRGNRKHSDEFYPPCTRVSAYFDRLVNDQSNANDQKGHEECNVELIDPVRQIVDGQAAA
jgi:hypothetical protein